MDYKKIGLMSGIEIHQQLDTGKLFCSCPSVLRTDKPDLNVGRRLHVVAGEAGQTDEAAEYEKTRDRQFIYEFYNDTNCLIELDEAPPKLINQDALKIALQISLLLNCEIVPVSQIMRKTVIDGSNTSGFQRTVQIARNGYVETKQGKIGIEGVFLEEDAARIISRDKENNKIVYRLDRLGIPLVEIATAPDIKTPKQAREVALQIGEILRACKVKRGIGTIRQDVNISIANGKKQRKRIEVKGVQEPRLIQKVIENEAKRQLELIKKKKNINEVRKANPDGSTSFLRPMPGASRMYPETDLPLLKISRQLIDEVKKSLPRLKSELRHELRQEGLNEELISLLLKENKLQEYKELLHIIEEPSLIVKMLTLWLKEIASHEKKSQTAAQKKLNIDVLEAILQSLNKNQIQETDIKQIMADIVNGKNVQEALKIEKVDIGKIEEEILHLIKGKPGLNINAYMGLIMKKFKGFSGKQIIEILKKYVK